MFFFKFQEDDHMINRQNFTVFITAVLAIGLVFSGPVLSASETIETSPAEHKFELARQYHGQCSNVDNVQFDNIQPQLKAFTDMEVMADTMADPLKFMQLMAVVNDPHTIHTMTKCATEPVMWDTWMRGMTDFNKMSNTMGKFMNPNMYFAWMMASMNPQMYQPMMKMADPGHYNRWMAAMMNPVFFQPVTSLADPNWFTPRINWMMNPQSMQPMFNMMQMGQLAQPVQAQQPTPIE